jgi:hypothetical protein
MPERYGRSVLSMVGVTASGAANPGAPEPATRRVWWASPGMAMALGALALVMTVLALVLSAMTHQLSVLGSGPILPVVVAYAAVGVVVARRQPGNPIGWILVVFIVVFLVSDVVGAYAALYYKFGHHGLPLAAAAVILQPSWAPALLLFPVAILLFPDGRLASRHWQRLLGVYLLGGALASAAIYSPAVEAVARHDVRLDDFGDVTSSGQSAGGLLSALEVLGFGLIAAALFTPVRRRVQHAVDRRFNRARYNADEAVAAFAGRLKEAVDLDSVHADLAGVVQRTLEPAHLSVWLSRSAD